MEGSFDWRVQVEAPGNLTELVFLSEFWQILKAPLPLGLKLGYAEWCGVRMRIDQDGAEVVGCAVAGAGGFKG